MTATSSDKLFLELERLTPGSDAFLDAMTRYRTVRRHEIEEVADHEAALARWERAVRAQYYRDIAAILWKATPPLFNLVWISLGFFWLFGDNGRNLDRLFDVVFTFISNIAGVS